MQKFLLRIFVFLLPVLIFAWFADHYISKNIKRSTSAAQKEYPVWNDILEGKLNADILIYGSSRAWVHIDPLTISKVYGQKAYNLGIDGHNFFMQHMRHKLALKYNKQPSVIIQSLDAFTLKRRNDLYNLEQFLPYMYFNSEIESYTSKFEGFTYLDYRVPLLRYFGQKNLFEKLIDLYVHPEKNVPKRVNGFQAQNKKWNNDLNKAKKKMKKLIVDLDSSTIALFRGYLDECKKKNIQVIFVYTPEFIEGQSFIANRKKIIDIYEDFSKEFQIPFLNYSNDSISFNRNYFYNALHMNKTGTTLFMQKFVNDLQAVLPKKQSSL